MESHLFDMVAGTDDQSGSWKSGTEISRRMKFQWRSCLEMR